MSAVMNVVPQVVFDEDASPLARIFARSLNHALLTPEGARILRSINVAFALKSAKGKQAITIDPTDDHIEVTNGIHSNAAIVIALDLDDPAVKPDVVKGMMRHPIQLMRISNLLQLPEPDWQESAHSFWAVASKTPDCPVGLALTNLTDGSKIELGQCDEGEIVEIQAPLPVLQSLLSGQSLLAAEAMGRKIRYYGSLRHLAGLSQAGQAIMLGSIDG